MLSDHVIFISKCICKLDNGWPRSCYINIILIKHTQYSSGRWSFFIPTIEWQWPFQSNYGLIMVFYARCCSIIVFALPMSVNVGFSCIIVVTWSFYIQYLSTKLFSYEVLVAHVLRSFHTSYWSTMIFLYPIKVSYDLFITHIIGPWSFHAWFGRPWPYRTRYFSTIVDWYQNCVNFVFLIPCFYRPWPF